MRGDSQVRFLGGGSRREGLLLPDHLWASTAIFHWNCFIALMKSLGEAGAEEATWQGDGHAPPSLTRVRNGKREPTK